MITFRYRTTQRNRCARMSIRQNSMEYRTGSESHHALIASRKRGINKSYAGQSWPARLYLIAASAGGPARCQLVVSNGEKQKRPQKKHKKKTWAEECTPR